MIEIRTASLQDKSEWLGLWNAYLSFYGTAIPDDVTEGTWTRFHDAEAPIFLIGAYDGAKMIGFVVYVLHLSSWAKTGYCYLEDLFVCEEARGQGAGRLLILEVKNRAIKADSTRLYWNTKEDNKAARLLYDKVARVSDFVEYRTQLGG